MGLSGCQCRVASLAQKHPGWLAGSSLSLSRLSAVARPSDILLAYPLSQRPVGLPAGWPDTKRKARTRNCKRSCALASRADPANHSLGWWRSSSGSSSRQPTGERPGERAGRPANMAGGILRLARSSGLRAESWRGRNEIWIVNVKASQANPLNWPLRAPCLSSDSLVPAQPASSRPTGCQTRSH